MSSRFNIALLLLTFTGISACDQQITTTTYSFIDGEEYVNEPLSDDTAQFEAHLLQSNRLINYVRNHDVGRIYAAASSGFRQANSRAVIADILESIDESLGEIVEYKPQQWSFTTRPIGLVPVVYSSKIVMHENGEAIYHFAYVDDGPPDGYYVFHVSLRGEGETIAQVASKVLNHYEGIF